LSDKNPNSLSRCFHLQISGPSSGYPRLHTVYLFPLSKHHISSSSIRSLLHPFDQNPYVWGRRCSDLSQTTNATSLEQEQIYNASHRKSVRATANHKNGCCFEGRNNLYLCFFVGLFWESQVHCCFSFFFFEFQASDLFFFLVIFNFFSSCSLKFFKFLTCFCQNFVVDSVIVLFY